MKKNVTIILVAIVCICLLLSFSLYMKNRQRAIPMTESEIQYYQKYQIDTSSASDEDLVGWILAIWRNGEYGTQVLESYLYDCVEIYDVAQWGELVLIDYFASNDLRVIMMYDSSGMRNKSIYDERTDTTYFMSDEEKTRHINSRHGW